MELHIALKHIIETEGLDIIKEAKLINILDDFRAYENIPTAKYILRAIIADGYMNTLLQLGAWSNKIPQLAMKFANTTGFVSGTVDLIFQSIAYGLGWRQDIQSMQSVNRSNSLTKNTPAISSKWRAKMTEEEQEQYILSLFDFDHSKEDAFHVYLTNVSFSVDRDKEIKMYYEFEKRSQLTKFVSLNYSLYDLKGRTKGRSVVGCMDENDINPKPDSCRFYELKVNQISRIRLWWE